MTTSRLGEKGVATCEGKSGRCTSPCSDPCLGPEQDRDGEGVRTEDPSGSTPRGSQNGPPDVYEDNPAGRYDIKHH